MTNKHHNHHFPKETAVVPEDISLTCVDGITIAGQRWQYKGSNGGQSSNSPPSSRTPTLRILCLHGWLDNCRSYYHLAPNLVTQLQEKQNQNAIVVALDLPGHGQSSHKSVDGPFVLLSEYAFYVAEAMALLKWDNNHNSDSDSDSNEKVVLIGHSMSCAIALLYASCYPEQIAKLVLLEGVGPRAMEAQDIAQHVKKHIDARRRGVAKPRPPSMYPSMEAAVEARCMTAKSFPGKQHISPTAARELVRRATKDIVVHNNNSNNNNNNEEGEVSSSSSSNSNITPSPPPPSLKFLHDPRLYWPSLQYFTYEQTESLYTTIQCKVCLLLGEDGWPFHLDDRLSRAKELLKPSMVVTLPGSHHFHMDPDTCHAVVHAVLSFLCTL
jgi:pimeloyl-ACP methyl ester carboxylesterase